MYQWNVENNQIQFGLNSSDVDDLVYAHYAAEQDFLDLLEEKGFTISTDKSDLSKPGHAYLDRSFKAEHLGIIGRVYARKSEICEKLGAKENPVSAKACSAVGKPTRILEFDGPVVCAVR